MIGIHRSKPVTRLGQREIRLSRAEHRLLITLGMMDNKIVPIKLLVETTLENPVPGPTAENIIRLRIGRLRQKLGASTIRNKPSLGYILDGPVYFFGETSA